MLARIDLDSPAAATILLLWMLVPTSVLLGVKSYLHSRGYPGIFPWWAGREMHYLKRLIAIEEDPSRRRRLERLRIAVYIAFGWLAVGLIVCSSLLSERS